MVAWLLVIIVIVIIRIAELNNEYNFNVVIAACTKAFIFFEVLPAYYMYYCAYIIYSY